MTNWHLIHLGHLALSGAALLTIEATAVLPEGRITYADVGLWSDETEAAIGRTLESIRRYSDIQVRPAMPDARPQPVPLGGAQILRGADGWQTVAPSAFRSRRGESADRAQS